MKNVKNRSAIAKLSFIVLESLADGKLKGFFKYKDKDAPLMVDNKLVRVVARAGLIEKNITIIEGLNQDDIIAAMPFDVKPLLRSSILKPLKIDDIIKKDISANIIVPDFIPVVYDPSRRGNRKPRFHYR